MTRTDADRVAVRDSEARLRLALDAAKLGTFDLDVATGRLVWDELKMRMWGISKREDFRYPAILDGVHPEDRAAVAAAVGAASGASPDVLGSGGRRTTRRRGGGGRSRGKNRRRRR